MLTRRAVAQSRDGQGIATNYGRIISRKVKNTLCLFMQNKSFKGTLEFIGLFICLFISSEDRAHYWESKKRVERIRCEALPPAERPNIDSPPRPLQLFVVLPSI
jgi:hypothetical protein